MIPVKNAMTQTDELPAEDGQEFEFGIGDPRWVMRTQAELYSDITTAIIREYSTNAWDAHVMAGNPDPIKVTLPTLMDPFFVVEDKGVGMDVEIFKKVYTQFGVSDKRQSSKTNGMLGYGSKSGVAYTTTFKVTSVKNGIKTHAVITRKPDWAITLKVVKTQRTDEPNGTIIKIPVHNWQEFCFKAQEFYKYWLPGRVLVNEKEPDHAVGIKITDNLYFPSHADYNKSFVVMGNVAYRVNNPSALFSGTRMNAINFVAYVDGMGENGEAAVEFTPSREDLKYTEHTKATLAKIIKDFETSILKVAKSEVANAESHWKAYLAWKSWTDRLGKSLFSELTYKGDKFESEFAFDGYRYKTSGNTYGRATAKVTKWDVEAMENTFIITDYAMSLSSRHKTMAKDVALGRNWNHRFILFTHLRKDEITSPWISKDHILSWETVKAEAPKPFKKPRGVYGGPTRIAGSFDYYQNGKIHREQTIPDDAKKIFYISTQPNKVYNTCDILKHLNDETSIVVILPKNRQNKFVRDYPEVKEFIAYAVAKVVKDGPSLLSDEAKEVVAISDNVKKWLSLLDLGKIDDPKLKEMAVALKNEGTLTKKYHDNLALAKALRMWYDVKRWDPTKVDYMNEHYPMMPTTNAWSSIKVPEHAYLYMNAVYAAESEKNE